MAVLEKSFPKGIGNALIIDQARAARTEIERRILAVDARENAAGPRKPASASRLAALTLATAGPLAAQLAQLQISLAQFGADGQPHPFEAASFGVSCSPAATASELNTISRRTPTRATSTRTCRPSVRSLPPNG